MKTTLNQALCLALASASLLLITPQPGFAQIRRDDQGNILKFDQVDKFRQLEEILPTPNAYRNASGAPGHGYWQQRADYVIDVELDDVNQRIIGSERITYHNNSPDSLKYLWLQLDNNNMMPDADSVMAAAAPDLDDNGIPFGTLESLLARQVFDGGLKLTRVEDADGNPLDHIVVKTMMRIDLPTPLKPGDSTTFEIDWNYNINDGKVIWARTGYEYFEKDDNYIYEISQWYPRMAAYTDVNGWQHKQFLGRGEFTLELGDYEINITAPDDHIVGATGVIQNLDEVLTPSQRDRYAQSRTATTPMFIVTPKEAKANESTEPTGKKTWRFKAENVRDVAWASSRKFIWDAQGHDVGGNTVMAMSLYPNEAEPLWSKFSTHAIIHTLNVYSRYTFDYPYPVAYSINGPQGGMEFPMICYNGPRPEEDGTYSARTKYGLIGVIIHEVGHNYFPMIVNSDERQWTWMDEGLNTFLQYLTEQEWEEEYPSRRGEPRDIVGYMASYNQVPIMTNSESLLQFGPNAYAKPATALNILRETILGRELFDFAFKEYAQRWMFKRPEPSDLFRTMEDASGIDLDWFWRGWFYTTDHTDLSIENVRLYQIDTRDPYVEKAYARQEESEEPESFSKQRNNDLAKRTDTYPELEDFYNEFTKFDVTPQDRKDFERFLKRLDDDEKMLLNTEYNFYIVDLKNKGGLVMPIIFQVAYEDGTSEEIRIPVEIWRHNNLEVSKLIMTSKMIREITLDPRHETADVDLDNNVYPRRPVKSRFQLFKSRDRKNPMQKARQNDEDIDKDARKAEQDAEQDARRRGN
ncbi:MAG: M1 family metallopeptidase [Planctomycetota bacterium]|nr:M1 family metallopeptidase [Planctomycetota bacterium]